MRCAACIHSRAWTNAPLRNINARVRGNNGSNAAICRKNTNKIMRRPVALGQDAAYRKRDNRQPGPHPRLPQVCPDWNYNQSGNVAGPA